MLIDRLTGFYRKAYEDEKTESAGPSQARPTRAEIIEARPQPDDSGPDTTDVPDTTKALSRDSDSVSAPTGSELRRVHQGTYRGTGDVSPTGAEYEKQTPALRGKTPRYIAEITDEAGNVVDIAAGETREEAKQKAEQKIKQMEEAAKEEQKKRLLEKLKDAPPALREKVLKAFEEGKQITIQDISFTGSGTSGVSPGRIDIEGVDATQVGKILREDRERRFQSELRNQTEKVPEVRFGPLEPYIEKYEKAVDVFTEFHHSVDPARTYAERRMIRGFLTTPFEVPRFYISFIKNPFTTTKAAVKAFIKDPVGSFYEMLGSMVFFELAPKLRLRSPSQEFIIKTEPIRTRWYADYMKEGRGGWYADLTRQSRIQYGDVMGPSKLRTTVKTEITPADMSQQLRLKPAVKEVGLKHIEWEETVKGKRVKVRINKESLWTDEMARTTLVPKEKTPVRGYTPKVEFRPQFRDVERLRTYKVPLEPAKGTPIRPFSLPLDRAFQNIQPGFQIDQSLGINLRDAFRFGTKEGTFQIDVLDTSPVTSQDLDNSLETDLDLDTTQTTAQTTGGITTTTSPPPPRFPTPPPPKIDIPDIPDIIRKRPKPTPGTLIELEPIDVNIDLGLWGVKHRMLENVYGDIFGGGIKLDVDFKADLKLDLDLDLKL